MRADDSGGNFRPDFAAPAVCARFHKVICEATSNAKAATIEFRDYIGKRIARTTFVA